MHTAKKAARRKRRLPLQRVSADQFRETRRACGFSREDAAAFLGVSLRTVGHWETGKTRPLYAAFRLLRVMRNGDLVDPAWSEFKLIRGNLVTPENHSFAPHELVWLSLLVRRARAFSELRARLESQGMARAGTGARAARCVAPARRLGAFWRARGLAGGALLVAGSSDGTGTHPISIRSPGTRYGSGLRSGLTERLPSSNRGVKRSGSGFRLHLENVALAIAGGIR
jgi:DNA-binding transcriptional regulator YiaG